MVEQRTENPCVGSSILPFGTPKRHGTVAQRLEQATHNRLVAGSIPASPTGIRQKQNDVLRLCYRKSKEL